MGTTDIQWTDSVWNPVRGCTRVSPGCDNCYAMRQAHRFNTPSERSPYHGLTIYREGGSRPGVDWSGKVRLVPEMLSVPLRWKKPRRIFVNSMSDLFHESLSNEEIAAVFGVMAACPQHTFQVLTKRAKRMREWFEWAAKQTQYAGSNATITETFRCIAIDYFNVDGELLFNPVGNDCEKWPLPNVWLGVSAEDQQRADERIPHLLATPAAVRFVSAEPLLERIDLSLYMASGFTEPPYDDVISWVIAGGESGNGARPCDVEWIRTIVDHCDIFNCACFVKQLGADPHDSMRSMVCGWEPGDPEPDTSLHLSDKKGGEIGEWPEVMRVREFPQVSP